MSETHEHGPVDLRFAKAYLLICALYTELVGVLALVFLSRLDAIESWTLAAIVVWFLERIITEEVLQYNSLLETAALASILTHYRVLRDDNAGIVIERAICTLWFTCFVTVNVMLSMPAYSTKRTKSHYIGMWGCTLVLMLYSVYVPMRDSIIAFDGIKAFLFLTVSIIWVYIFDSANLRYDRLHDC